MKNIILLVLSILFLFSPLSFANNCLRATALYNEATISRDIREKEKLFKKALTLPCSDNNVLARIHNNLGDTYEKTNRLNEATGEYNKAIALYPNLPTPYISLGDVYSKIGDKVRAGEYYHKYWLLASFKTRGQLTNALSLRSPQRSIVPVPSSELYFGFNEAILTAESTRQLEELLAAISGNELRSYTFELSGHTCDIGSDAYNQGLSERRAAAVKEWLVAHGYSSSKLETKGFGKRNPTADNSTEEGKKLNRRVEIRTTGAVVIGKRSAGKGAELFERGRSLVNEGKFQEAAANFEKALGIFRRGQLQDEANAALANLYITCLATGDIENALKYNKEMQGLK